MAHSLGIDVGTTFCAVAASDGGPAHLVPLSVVSPLVPTVVQADEGVLRFGAEAAARALEQPWATTRDLKRRFGDPTPLVLSGVPYAADRLYARLLAHLAWSAQRALDDDIAEVSVTHPASWGGYRLKLLEEAMLEAGLPPATLLSEPHAAAIHHLGIRHGSRGGPVLVYDFGGGSTDVIVLRGAAEGFIELGEGASLDRVGGADLDEVLFGLVLEELRLEPGQLPADPQGLPAVARLRDDCVRAKVALSEAPTAIVPVSLPGRVGEVIVTRAEFEARIRPLVVRTVDLVAHVLDTAGVAPRDLGHLLVVGGSSRVPLVTELLAQRLGVRATSDEHPKYPVALGAAMVAAGRSPQTEDHGQAVPAGGGASRTIHVDELMLARLRDRTHAELLVLSGPSGGERHHLEPGRTELGRAPAEGGVVVDDLLVSRRHCWLDREGADVTVTDADSLNHTRVDGHVITGPVPLEPGQVLRIGSTLLLRADAPAAGQAQVADLSEVWIPSPPAPGPLGDLLRRSPPRRARLDYERQLAEVGVRLDEAHRTVLAQRRARSPGGAQTLSDARAAGGARPRRRRVDRDQFLALTVGYAELPSELLVEVPDRGDPQLLELAHSLARSHAHDGDVPVVVPLVAVRSLGVIAPAPVAAGVARSLVAQLVLLHAADEVLPLIVTGPDDVDRWAWTSALGTAPSEQVEVGNAAEGASLCDRVADEARAGRHVVVVIPGLRADLEPLLAALVTDPTPGTSVVWCSAGATLTGTRAVLDVDAITGLGELDGWGPGGSVADVVPATVSAVSAAAATT